MIRELWKQIDRWFEDHQATKNLEKRGRPATKAQLAALEKTIGRKLPADLRESLEIHDGGGSFESYELYSAKQIADEWKRKTEQHEEGSISKRLWNRAWIPFAQDGAGNLKAVDPDNNRLLALEFQGPQGVFATRRRTFTDFLASYASKLQLGKLVVDEEGFVDEPHPPREVHPDEVGKELEATVVDAVGNDDVATVRRLLDAKTIKPDSRTTFKYPILTQAAQSDSPQVVDLLLERGANVNIDVGGGNRNPLIACCYSNDPKLHIIEKLLEAGADPNTKDDDHTKKNALAVAEMYKQPALIALLQKYGATAPKQTTPKQPARKAATAKTASKTAGSKKPARNKKR